MARVEYNKIMRRYLRWGFFLPCVLLSLRQAPCTENLVPKGFAPDGTETRYGPPDRKLADGTIFDYMDGGGIVYLDHGFQELIHCEFSNSLNGLITFDRFIMDTSAQALAALADERIAPAGGKFLPLGAANRGYRFPPDYFIYMVLDKSLVYLHVNDDALAAVLDQFAVDILNSLKEGKE